MILADAVDYFNYAYFEILPLQFLWTEQVVQSLAVGMTVGIYGLAANHSAEEGGEGFTLPLVLFQSTQSIYTDPRTLIFPQLSLTLTLKHDHDLNTWSYRRGHSSWAGWTPASASQPSLASPSRHPPSSSLQGGQIGGLFATGCFRWNIPKNVNSCLLTEPHNDLCSTGHCQKLC